MDRARATAGLAVGRGRFPETALLGAGSAGALARVAGRDAAAPGTA